MLSTKIIGNKITEARKKTNISQAQLAEQLFISSQAVGKWERGESLPDIITLNRLAEILGVDLNYFSEDFPSAVNGERPFTEKNDSPAKADKPGKKLNWDMSRGSWADADFSGLKNLHEKFSSSHMKNCKFIDSDLSELLLSGNHITSCDFSGSDISKSRIEGSYMTSDLFRECLLKETEFTGSYISGCDLSNADLSNVKFKSGGFEKNTIENTLWNQTSFSGMYIADVVFNGIIEDCYFENCAFKRVTFQDAVLTNTFFKNRSLKQIKFVNCQADRMTYEFLKNGKANLSGITLVNM